MAGQADALKSILFALFATSAIAAINKVEREFRSEFAAVSWLFFEPDVTD